MSDEPINETPEDAKPVEVTAPLWTQYAPTTPPPPGTTVLTAPAAAAGGRNSGKSLGVILGATGLSLVVGGAAGIGGAAYYNHEHKQDSSSVSTVGNGSTSPVVQSDGSASETTLEAVAHAVLPSVVKIEAQGGQTLGTGSGIIFSPDGKILTNNHVVDFAAKSGGRIRVDFNDGTFANATVLGTDPLTDTAVIQAQGVSGLHPLAIGKSSALQVGQSVLAIGSPYGLNGSVTAGIVSALNRPTDVTQGNASNRTVYPAIQTDAAINPGNSGGPLVDLSGRLVGINASIHGSGSSGASGQSGSIGLGFAIPIDAILPIVDELSAGKPATHAKLGVSVGDVGGKDAVSTTEGDVLFGTNGAKVEKVTGGSAAANAGLQNGDIITKVDNHPVTTSDGLVATIRAYRPGNKVTVTYVRNGQTATAQVTLDSDAASASS
ncbi:putative serine protease [Nocardioides baekrokdamisoli]|uniref:Putative serine protease n=1 Tax=Nocardioides baekrokdamisoli TaxID=1804624 RepID=A0A3G9IFU7_9ACTN|nr:trypsin-like peptidase domain-containing protein [Nocardioides baekrokdamisoli]BBH17930.1 putative serine protease [Nocardioides baekrokdamisoli]